MDSEQLRETLRALEAAACPFEKAILPGHCDCSRAGRFCIAERQGVQCRSATARDRCLRLLGWLRELSRFALRLREVEGLSHAKGLRLQVGGLRGLVKILAPEEPASRPIMDVFRLTQTLEARYPHLADVPPGPILREIAAYRGRVPLRERPQR